MAGNVGGGTIRDDNGGLGTFGCYGASPAVPATTTAATASCGLALGDLGISSIGGLSSRIAACVDGLDRGSATASGSFGTFGNLSGVGSVSSFGCLAGGTFGALSDRCGSSGRTSVSTGTDLAASVLAVPAPNGVSAQTSPMDGTTAPAGLDMSTIASLLGGALSDQALPAKALLGNSCSGVARALPQPSPGPSMLNSPVLSELLGTLSGPAGSDALSQLAPLLNVDLDLSPDNAVLCILLGADVLGPVSPAALAELLGLTEEQVLAITGSGLASGGAATPGGAAALSNALLTLGNVTPSQSAAGGNTSDGSNNATSNTTSSLSATRDLPTAAVAAAAASVAPANVSLLGGGTTGFALPKGIPSQPYGAAASGPVLGVPPPPAAPSPQATFAAAAAAAAAAGTVVPPSALDTSVLEDLLTGQPTTTEVPREAAFDKAALERLARLAAQQAPSPEALIASVETANPVRPVDDVTATLEEIGKSFSQPGGGDVAKASDIGPRGVISAPPMLASLPATDVSTAPVAETTASTASAVTLVAAATKTTSPGINSTEGVAATAAVVAAAAAAASETANATARSKKLMKATNNTMVADATKSSLTQMQVGNDLVSGLVPDEKSKSKPLGKVEVKVASKPLLSRDRKDAFLAAKLANDTKAEEEFPPIESNDVQFTLGKSTPGKKLTLQNAFEELDDDERITKAAASQAIALSSKIFIGGIPRGSNTEQSIKMECARHGAVTSMFYSEDPGESLRPQGSAFVTFATPEMASIAVRRMSQQTGLFDSIEPLRIRLATGAGSEATPSGVMSLISQEKQHQQAARREKEEAKQAVVDDRGGSNEGDRERRGGGAKRKRSRSRRHHRRRSRSRARRRDRGGHDSAQEAGSAMTSVDKAAKRRGLGGFGSSTGAAAIASDVAAAAAGGGGGGGGRSSAASPLATTTVDISTVATATTSVGGDDRPRQVAARGSWAQFVTPSGSSYYHNITTGKTVWEKPAEFEMPASRRSSGDGPAGSESTLFVFHLPSLWTDDDLTTHFRPFGSFQRATIQRASNGLSRGFGFVAFAQHEDAMTAISTMNGFHVDGKILKVSLKSSPFGGASTESALRE
eukprot:TRINITY_DN9755_c0_g1_i1.p1 TRINITY_DN9755_c0_g1~~TRINITY_DN9755_c0_g1_i1.p1  ORF type:complete len:1097 (+),score=201.05 TRINITY_DN9755_c0_g1_i1:88-3378(+)